MTDQMGVTVTVDSPDPCRTLKARLSLASFLAHRESYKSNMKSVDRTATDFKRRFSGLPGEDWIGHLDMLEIMRANKHQWTAREFYYGLQHTLAGKARSTVSNLEQSLECPELTMFLPDWFECDMQELREMIAGRCGFPELEPRTKVAVLIAYFQDRFQMCSAERAIENFKYSTQASEESVEDWGIRIGRLKRALEKFGRHVPFEVYLQKWKTGTRAAFFTAKLREATMPDDYTRDPVVFDMQSFRAWYQQFLRKQRERDKDRREYNQMAMMDRFHQLARRKGRGHQILMQFE